MDPGCLKVMTKLLCYVTAFSEYMVKNAADDESMCTYIYTKDATFINAFPSQSLYLQAPSCKTFLAYKCFLFCSLYHGFLLCSCEN